MRRFKPQWKHRVNKGPERVPMVLIFWFQTTYDQHPLKPYPRLLLIHEDVLEAWQEKRFKIQTPNSSYYGRRTFGSSVPELEDDFWVFKYLPLSWPHLYCCWHSSGPGRVKGRPGDAFFRCALGEDVQTGPWLLPCSAEHSQNIQGTAAISEVQLQGRLWPPQNLLLNRSCLAFCSSRKLISLGVVKCEASALLAFSEEPKSLDFFFLKKG